MSDKAVEFVNEHIRLVHYVANRFKNQIQDTIYDYDDLITIGKTVVLKQYESYDPSIAKASTYLVPWIQGTISRVLRDTKETVKYSRLAKETAYKIIREDIGHLSTKEIAERLEVSYGTTVSAIDFMRHHTPYSLNRDVNEQSEDKEITLQDQVTDQNSVDPHNDLSLEVKLMLEELPEKERFLVQKYYLEGYSQIELSKAIGTSQVQVSRLLTKSLKLLKEIAEKPDKPKKKPKIKKEGLVIMGLQGKGDREKAKQMLLEGVPTKKVSEETGVPYSTVGKVKKDLKDAGVIPGAEKKANIPVTELGKSEVKAYIQDIEPQLDLKLVKEKAVRDTHIELCLDSEMTVEELSKSVQMYCEGLKAMGVHKVECHFRIIKGETRDE